MLFHISCIIQRFNPIQIYLYFFNIQQWSFFSVSFHTAISSRNCISSYVYTHFFRKRSPPVQVSTSQYHLWPLSLTHFVRKRSPRADKHTAVPAMTTRGTHKVVKNITQHNTHTEGAAPFEPEVNVALDTIICDRGSWNAKQGNVPPERAGAARPAPRELYEWTRRPDRAAWGWPPWIPLGQPGLTPYHAHAHKRY